MNTVKECSTEFDSTAQGRNECISRKTKRRVRDTFSPVSVNSKAQERARKNVMRKRIRKN